MPNQYKNKVVYGNQVLIDLTDTTATAEDVVSGKYFYAASGKKTLGTKVAGNPMTVVETPDSHGGTVVTITGDEVKLQSKTITPTKSSQTVQPDTGYTGFAAVTVEAIPAQYITTTDATATAGDILRGKSAYVNGSKLNGSLVIQHYYTGADAPSASLGENGDIYLRTGE